MPDSAAGTTTRVETCILDERQGVGASRRLRGTAVIASSDRLGDRRHDHDAHDDAGDEQVLKISGRSPRARCPAGAG